MSITSRLSAWWSAWQFVVYLALALAASLYGNYIQFRHAIEAPLKRAVASKDKALDDSAALLANTQARADMLDKSAARAAANLDASSNDYRAAARTRPLAPNCAPGQARVDAVNRALGAQQEK